MCLSFPVQIVEVVSKDRARAKNNDKEFEIDISLVPKVTSGDWVLMQENAGIKKIDQKSVKEIFKLIKQ